MADPVLQRRMSIEAGDVLGGICVSVFGMECLLFWFCFCFLEQQARDQAPVAAWRVLDRHSDLFDEPSEGPVVVPERFEIGFVCGVGSR